MKREALTRRSSAMRTLVSRLKTVLVFTQAFCVLCGTAARAQTPSTTYTYSYDGNSNISKVYRQGVLPTYYIYDALNRPIESGQYDSSGGWTVRVKYAYNGQDQVVAVTDPRDLVTTYVFDGLGNQTEQHSPDTGVTNKTFDSAGNVATVTDARGKTTTFSYDALNRLTGISYSLGASTIFEYDGEGIPAAVGHLTRMSDESGTTAYAYEPFGKLARKVQSVGSGPSAKEFVLQYAYGTTGSTTGKLISITYPSGNRISLSYDGVGRVVSMDLNPGLPGGQGTDAGKTIPLLSGVGYAPFVGVNRWVWGNSTDTAQNTYARGFDLDGRVITYPLGNGLNNGPSRTVNYDGGGRIASMTHTGTGTGNLAPANFNQSFGYDNLERLKGWAASNASQAYWYDGNNNRTYIKFNNYYGFSNSVAADSNRILAASGPGPAKNFSYDASGNRTGDGATGYTYSDRGRLASAIIGAGTVTYLYNGLGQRVRKSGPSSVVPTGVNNYVYDEQGHLLGEYDVNGAVIQETVYLGDLPIAVLKQAGQ